MIKFQYLILLTLCLNILLISCDQKNEKIQKTSFEFKISNELRGKVSDKEGTVSLECKEDRIVLFFKEDVEDKTALTDTLIGEIILGFQKGDTTGVYQLNGISGKREKGKVGIVAFFDMLHFDDLAAQYILNPIRYEKVQNGSVEITEWSTEVGGIMKGNLNVKLGERANKVKIEGEFAVKWNAENLNCNERR